MIEPQTQSASPLRIACRSEATVLLTGPTGAGKSRLAREIHEGGPRRGKPFVTINLASVHEGTLESELFGHERGSFTSADSRRVGKLEFAQGGTVFLDEVGELPPRLQARLLEFLQSRVISPVGSNRETQLDVRVIAATNRDLSRAVAKGEFREDLYHRLRVLALELRPLRERADEFDDILHRCLDEVCRAAKRSVLRISEDLARSLESYDWPGNFRELRNVLEYAVLASSGDELTPLDLPPWFGACASSRGDFSNLLGVLELPLALNFEAAVSAFEKEYFTRALAHFRGRVNRTAREIGIDKSTLLRRMRAYGLSSGGPGRGAAGVA